MVFKRRCRKRRYSRKVPLRLKRYVKRVLKNDIELKHILGTGSINPDFSGIVAGISAIPQGDGGGQRDGDIVKLALMNIRMTITNADPTNAVRVIVFQWHPASTPNATSILAITGTVYAYQSPSKWSSTQQYSILMDKVFLVNAVSTPQRYYRFSSNFKRSTKKLVFDPAATTGTNQIYILAVSDSSVIAHPSLSYVVDLFYGDA